MQRGEENAQWNANKNNKNNKNNFNDNNKIPRIS